MKIGKILFKWNSLFAAAVGKRTIVTCSHLGVDINSTWQLCDGNGDVEPGRWLTGQESGNGKECNSINYSAVALKQVGELLFVTVSRDIPEYAIHPISKKITNLNVAWFSRVDNLWTAAWIQSDSPGQSHDKIPMGGQVAVEGDSGSPVFSGDHFIGIISGNDGGLTRLARCHIEQVEELEEQSKQPVKPAPLEPAIVVAHGPEIPTAVSTGPIPAKPKVEKWEYHTHVVKFYVVAAELNKLGSGGWEMCGSHTLGDDRCATYFKRRVQ